MKQEKLIALARQYCIHYHEWQFRKWNNLPYHTHPFEVLNILEKYWYTDHVTQCIALLHDVVEDTDLITWEIKNRFWYEIANWVYVLSKNTIKSNVSKMINASFDNNITFSNDQLYKIRLWFARTNTKRIKIADMIHNTQDLINLKGSWIIKKINDSKTFYVPMWKKIAPIMIKELEGNINNFFRIP